MIKTITFKTLKILGIIFGSIVVVLVIFSIVIQIFFKDQLTQYLIKELNKQVNAGIDVKSTEFSFWKTFPNASVGLNQVLIHPAKDFIKYNIVNNDTLLAADKIIFEFNIVKLISNNYVLNRIKVLNGKFNLEIDQIGNANYNIFQKGNGKGPELTLKNIVLRNCSIKYSNLRSDIFIKTFSARSNIKAIIHNNNFNFDITTNLFVDYIIIQEINYLNQHQFSSKGNISINRTSYNFNNVRFNIEKLNFLFNGKYRVGDVNMINLNVIGRDLNLSQLIDLLPEKYQQKSKNYSARGNIDLNVSINGRVGSLYNPRLNINCKINHGSIIERASKINLKGLDLEATYSNGLYNNKQSSVIQLLKFNGQLESGEFSIQGELINLLRPTIDIKGIAKFELNDIKTFLKLDTFEVLNGTVDGTFASHGVLQKTKQIRFSDVQFDTLTGNFSLKNANVKLKESDYNFNEINGLISVNKDISFDNITFKFNNNDIRLSGKLINGVSYILNQTNEATVDAELFSPFIDLSDYFKKRGEKSQNMYSRSLLFPENLNLNIKLNINEFKLNKFHAKWIKGNLQYKPTLFILKSLSLETLDGNLKGNGLIVQDISKHYIIKGQLDASKINIQKAFFTFNNFTQNIVKDNHLRGKLSGRIEFSSEWDDHLNFVPERLIMNANITIQNGELVNFEPMNGLSRFISLDELKNIKFSTLKNSIYVHDKQIIIPEMNINSSAFNISGSGIHHFDNHYQYKIRVLLSEVLYGKAKKAKKENEEYGRIEDDGLGRTGIYLNIEGFGKEYKISYDSRKTIDIVKESLVKQKQELKGILQEEFGWFKNDTTLKTMKKVKSNAVQVEFDGETETTNAQKSEPVDSKTKKKKDTEKMEVEWE